MVVYVSAVLFVLALFNMIIILGDACYMHSTQLWQCTGSDQCIFEWERCDGQTDCGNGSDEHYCANCIGTTCDDGRCIPSTRLCNGCFLNEWKCSTVNDCIWNNQRCDGRVDCTDGSDEVNCTACRNSNFLCKNGRCIIQSLHCDGRDDCGDNSDEKSCGNSTFGERCDQYHWRCHDTSRRCILDSNRCNGEVDCNDGSDELNCVACKNSNFLCSNRNDEASCAYDENSDFNPESFAGKFYGGIFGGIGGLMILIFASTIIIIAVIVIVCVRKRKRRQQPPIGVLEIGPEDNVDDNISLVNKDDEIVENDIAKGVAENHEEINWCSNVHLEY